VGYGFYFSSYELCKRLATMKEDTSQPIGTKILLCGGIAGIVTWASVFPLDVIKTRLQAQTPPSRYRWVSLPTDRRYYDLRQVTYEF